MPNQPDEMPAFDGDGYLPEGFYPCNEEGVRLRFVEPYEDSASRRDFFDGFVRWRTDVLPLIDGVTQWVGGNIDTHRIILKTKDDSYTGVVSPDAQNLLKDVKPGSWVNALIKEIKKFRTKARTEPTVKYTLESIFETVKQKEETMDLFE